MEELRSTDILDKEIQEDARKKAERILVTAHDEVQKILGSVNERLETIKKDKEKLYESKVEHFIRDCEASVPLERERFLVSFQAKAVREAIDNYLSTLTIQKKEAIFEKFLEKYRPALEGKKLIAKVFAFDADTTASLLKKVFGKTALESVTVVEASEVCGPSDYLKEMEGFIIDTSDGSVRCRVMLSELVEELIDKYSYELTLTLFGGRIPE